MTIEEVTQDLSIPSFPGGQEAPWASRVFQVAEWMQIPLYCQLNWVVGRCLTVLTPGEFGNCHYKIVELAWRMALIGAGFLGSTFTIATSITAVGANCLGDYLLGSQPYLYFKGNYSGENQSTFATWNMSTLLPTMTMSDGMDYSNQRVKEISKQLKDFQFVCGQEVDGASARFLAQELKNDFKEFYTYLGKSNAPLLSSGLFFASKEKVQSVKVIPFTGHVQKTIKRELVIFEFKDYCVAMMHLDSGNGNLSTVHALEIEQADQELAKYNKPVIWCGDFNEDRNQKSSAYQALTKHFVDCIPDDTVTCTDALERERLGKKPPISQQSIDYILHKRDQPICAFVKAKHFKNLSDHSLIIGKFTQISTV